ncbi:MAG: MFS transporter, partial [Alphaproteobacteria bacterium PA3]
ADRQVFNVVLPLIRADLALTDQAMGLIATTFTAVYGILVPFAGMAGDLIDRRKVVFLSLVVFSLGTLLTGVASSFLLLLLFRGVATGAGEAFYSPAAASLIGSAHERTRARALSIHQTANYTGIVLGSLVAGWVGQTWGWRAAFLVFGVGGLAWSVLLYVRARHFILPERHGPSNCSIPTEEPGLHRGQFSEALRLVLTTPALLGQLLAFGGLVFVIVGFLTWSPTLLYERFRLSLADAGCFSVFYHHLLAYVGVVGAGWATDRLIDKWPRVRLYAMAFGLIASGPCIWWGAQTTNLSELYIALALFGLFRGIYDSGIFAAIFDFVDDR